MRLAVTPCPQSTEGRRSIMKKRITWGIAGALTALTVSLVAFAGTPGAVATQGQAIIAGTGNSEEVTTRLYNTTLPGCVLPFSDIGMSVCGGIGLTGGGTRVGVWGVTTDNSTGFGVEGSTVKGTGVFGHNSGSTGIGVWGQTAGVGSAVYGEATKNGAGVFGDTIDGVGVQARSTSGIALNVLGKARFSRSGVAWVVGTSTASRNWARVTLPITAKSMMAATLQKYVPGVFVLAAVPNVTGGYFTIYLNKAVTTTVGPISWMVVERP